MSQNIQVMRYTDIKLNQKKLRTHEVPSLSVFHKLRETSRKGERLRKGSSFKEQLFMLSWLIENFLIIFILSNYSDK